MCNTKEGIYQNVHVALFHTMRPWLLETLNIVIGLYGLFCNDLIMFLLFGASQPLVIVHVRYMEKSKGKKQQLWNDMLVSNDIL